MPENCGNCRFFVRAAVMQPAGMCHAGPPTALLIGMAPPQLAGQSPRPLTNSFWPVIPDTEWCGAWSERRPVLEEALKIDLERLTPDAIEGSA